MLLFLYFHAKHEAPTPTTPTSTSTSTLIFFVIEAFQLTDEIVAEEEKLERERDRLIDPLASDRSCAQCDHQRLASPFLTCLLLLLCPSESGEEEGMPGQCAMCRDFLKATVGCLSTAANDVDVDVDAAAATANLANSPPAVSFVAKSWPHSS